MSGAASKKQSPKLKKRLPESIEAGGMAFYTAE
jgi:hypothetical protein